MDATPPAPAPGSRDAEVTALVGRLQSHYLRGAPPKQVLDALLPELLAFSGGAYGFIAETWRDEIGRPYLKIFTLTDIAWDDATREMLSRELPRGIEFRNLDTLFGAPLVSGAPIIANDARNDPRASGRLPPGHPGLDSFLGLPLFHGGELVGEIGLANRPGGFDDALVAALEPLTATVAAIIGSLRLERERQDAQRALREREARWRETFELADTGLALVSPDGHFIDVNLCMCQITGRSRQELLTLRFQDITHPDDLAHDDRLRTEMLAGRGQHYQMEKRYLRPDGSAVWVQLTVAAVPNAQGTVDHFVSVVHDITERKRVELLLRERDALLAKLTQQVPGMICRFELLPDGRTRVPFASDAVRQLFELEPEDLCDDGRPMIWRVPKDERARIWDGVVDSATELKPWRTEFPVDLPRGGRRWIEGHAMPEPRPGGGTLWHGYMTDITERKRVEAALVSARAAARANEAKTEFLSRMSHELRTPLNAVLGFAQLLGSDRSHPLDPLQRERIGHIERAGQHLLSMIGDVLDFSQIDAGTLALEPAAVPVRVAVEEAMALVAPLARRLDVAMQRPQIDAGLHVRADALRLRQALVNLLSNAVKYNRRGGSVRVEARRCAPARIGIEVHDTGIGLNDAQLGQLFQPFNRLGAERSAIEGTGLGLAITRKLVRLMGGDIHVRSAAGAGSCFTAELPQAESEAHAAAGDAASPPAPPGPRRHIVLYAEDHEVNVELVRQVLALREGCELRVARTGRDAIEQARAEPPDLLLLDMHLGDLSGLDVLHALSSEPALAGVPRVALSADALPGQVEAALAGGCSDYLTKPLDVAALLEILARHLDGPSS
ncbi:PAS domain S-box protein [Caldimonas sp. KR1-144]|uniref:PAS domain S-box protein n=1 Tax=Caldimonas sp. KR1-144 TaxID=3400911 RepID=UPI003C09BA9D